MNYLILPIFKTVVKKKEAWIVFGFGCFPLLLLVANLFNSNFMKISAPKGSLSFLEFFGAVEPVQYQLTLPVIALVYLVCSIFHDEIINGTMYIYKDISRRKILNAKICSIIIIYFIYFLITFITSFITYYLSLVHFSYTSGTFLPSKISDLQNSIITIVGIVVVSLICLFVATISSIKLGNGLTMVIGICFDIISQTAPYLKHLKYIFPNCYNGFLTRSNFSGVFLSMLGIFIVYFTFTYFVAVYMFKNLEY